MKPGSFIATFVALALAFALAVGPIAGCGGGEDKDESLYANSPYTSVDEDFHDADLGIGWEPVDSLALEYARCFTIDYYEGGYKLACLYDGGRYLLVPEGAPTPDGLASDIVVLQQPLENLYLVASDAGCLFDALGILDSVAVSGIKLADWSIPAIAEAMESGEIAYGGKYSAPDYDVLLQNGVTLAIESTMINHSPEVAEKIRELGMQVLTEMSSYEADPLGRAEWVKFYGALFDKEDLAGELFDAQVSQVKAIEGIQTGKTVAFFYINSNGAAVVRKPGDYVTRMIRMAGGVYAFDDLGETEGGTSTVTLEMERFYVSAKDVDIIIYNGTIDGGIQTLDQLVAKNELLANFKAVQEGNVWMTEQNMYQQSLEAGTIISDFNKAITGEGGDELTYLHRLT